MVLLLVITCGVGAGGRGQGGAVRGAQRTRQQQGLWACLGCVCRGVQVCAGVCMCMCVCTSACLWLG
jgi:hypothetical protein